MMTVALDTGDLQAVRLLLNAIPEGNQRARTRAINRTLAGARTDATTEVYKELNLTKTRIRKDFKIFRASRAWPHGQLQSKGKPVGVASFSGTRQTKKGVSVKIKRRGSRELLKHAFIATVKKARGAFWRDYGLKRAKYKPGKPYGRMPERYRLPIHRLSGPRIQDILGDNRVMARVMQKAGARYEKNYAHEIDYLLRQHR